MAFLIDGINHPTSVQVRAAGAGGVLMYLGTPGDGLGKDCTSAQVADYTQARLLRAYVYENGANDIAGGQSLGIAHANAFLADAHNKNVDSADPAGVTADEHLTASMIPIAVAYQTGFYHTLKDAGWRGPVGGYGFSEFLVAIHDAGVADWFWGAGSRTTLPAYTNVWQDNTGSILVGGSVDDIDWILLPLPTGGMVSDFTSPGNPLTPDGKSWSTLFGTSLTYGAELDAVLEALLLGAQAGPTWPAGPGVLQRLANVETKIDTIAAAVAAVDVEQSTLASALASEQAALMTAIAAEGQPQVTQAQLQAALAALNIGPATAQALSAFWAKAAGTTP